MADFLGLPLAPSLLGGTDYAFGGGVGHCAAALGGGAFILSVPRYVELYLRRHCGEADPNAMYILEGAGTTFWARRPVLRITACVPAVDRIENPITTMRCPEVLTGPRQLKPSIAHVSS